MLDFMSVMSGAPVPAVAAGDVRRVWEFITNVRPATAPAHGAAGIDIALIAQQCSEGADPVAVFLRVALVHTLLERGLLDDWRDGDRPKDVVFAAIAEFPLPAGLQSFQPESFAEALRKKL